MPIDSLSREIVEDCLKRLYASDACAPFDLATELVSHAHKKDIDLNLAVIEALALIAKRDGCEAAEGFLNQQWGDMKEILRKRWSRAGFG